MVDDLLVKLNDEEGFTTYGYADDIVIMIRGKDGSILSSLLQKALDITLNVRIRRSVNKPD